MINRGICRELSETRTEKFYYVINIKVNSDLKNNRLMEGEEWKR